MAEKIPQISEQALSDLEEIWFYIAGNDADRADRVIDDLYEAMYKLASMPGIGHRRRDLAPESLCFWQVYNYLIIYRPDEDPIEIV